MNMLKTPKHQFYLCELDVPSTLAALPKPLKAPVFFFFFLYQCLFPFLCLSLWQMLKLPSDQTDQLVLRSPSLSPLSRTHNRLPNRNSGHAGYTNTHKHAQRICAKDVQAWPAHVIMKRQICTVKLDEPTGGSLMALTQIGKIYLLPEEKS